MKRNIHFIITLVGLILTITLSAQENIERRNIDNLHQYNLLKINKLNILKHADKINDSSIKSFLRMQNPIFKMNSNYVLAEEIKEFTPSWGDPSKEKSEYSYDENGNNTQILRSAWSNSDWAVQGRGNLTYDEFDREIELLNQVLENSNWKDWYREATSYNSNDQIVEIVGYFKYTALWQSSWRQLNTYDENNKLIEIKSQWSDGTNFSDGGIIEYSYDENGLLVEEVSRYFDETWINGELFHYFYDESGKNIEMLQKNWNGSAWEDYYKTIISYNENNQQMSRLGYIKEENNWRNNTRWTSTYDDNQNNIEYLFEQNWDGSGWQAFERITRTFTQLVTSLDDKTRNLTKEFRLNQNYPNPFNPNTKISYSIPDNSSVTLKVFDTLGKEISLLVNEYQSKGNHQLEFDASFLPSGIYLYQLEAGNYVETKKMLLLK